MPAFAARSKRAPHETGEITVAPRYSITPGDFSQDARARRIHYRVMHFLGSKTDRSGWCVFSQTKLAAQFEVARETVNRAIGDLVEWGYVEKQAQQQTHRAVCFYRVLMDRHAPPALLPDESPDDAEIDGGTCDPTLTGRCDAPRHTGVTSTITQRETPLNNDQVKTPNPASGGQAGENFGDEAGETAGEGAGISAKQAGWLATLAGEGHPEAVMAELIRPLLTERRFSSSAALAELRAMIALAKGVPRPALAAAWRRLAEARHGGAAVTTIKPARLKAEIDLARRGGAMVVIRHGSAQWERWLAHFDQTDQVQARLMRRDGNWWQVRAEWPPAKGAADGEAA